MTIVFGHSLPCFLCKSVLVKRISKNGKPYFVCDSCGIQLFVRRTQGIERLQKFLDTFQENELLFKQAAERVFELQALLSEIDATKEQIRKLENEIGFIFQDEDKIRACNALKTRLEHLVQEFEEFCK